MISGKVIGGIILIVIGVVFSVVSIFGIILIVYDEVPEIDSPISGFRFGVAIILGPIIGPVLIFVGIKIVKFQKEWNAWNKTLDEK